MVDFFINNIDNVYTNKDFNKKKAFIFTLKVSFFLSIFSFITSLLIFSIIEILSLKTNFPLTIKGIILGIIVGNINIFLLANDVFNYIETRKKNVFFVRNFLRFLTIIFIFILLIKKYGLDLGVFVGVVLYQIGINFLSFFIKKLN